MYIVVNVVTKNVTGYKLLTLSEAEKVMNTFEQLHINSNYRIVHVQID